MKSTRCRMTLHQLEVHRDPEPDPSWPYGYRCASVKVFRSGESAAPLAIPGISMDVAALLGQSSP